MFFVNSVPNADFTRYIYTNIESEENNLLLLIYTLLYQSHKIKSIVQCTHIITQVHVNYDYVYNVHVCEKKNSHTHTFWKILDCTIQHFN